MASGKFQGEIATTVPRGVAEIKRLGLHGVVAAEIDRLAQFQPIVNGFARFVNQQRVYPLCSLLVLIGDPVENSGTRAGTKQRPGGALRGLKSPCHRLLTRLTRPSG